MYEWALTYICKCSYKEKENEQKKMICQFKGDARCICYREQKPGASRRPALGRADVKLEGGGESKLFRLKKRGCSWERRKRSFAFQRKQRKEASGRPL